MNTQVMGNAPVKKAPAETEAELLLRRQEEVAGESRKADFAGIAVFLLFIFVIAVAFFLVPDKAMSESENRVLTQAPKFTMQSFLDNSFTNDLADYYRDQFPARDFFRAVSAGTDLLLLKQETNDVYFAEGGYLIKNDALDFSFAEKAGIIKNNTDVLKAYAKNFNTAGAEIRLAVAGRTVDVMNGLLPPYYPDNYSQYFSEYATDSEGLSTVDLLTPLKECAAEGEAVYYKTDHHWTTLGAYYAYAEIMRSFGMEPLPQEDFTPEHVSTGFYGTTYSAAGASWVPADTIDFYRFRGDTEYETEIFDGRDFRTLEGFYDFDYLDVRDQYSAFLGGNNPLVKITKKGAEDRPVMILVKDSFGHALAPFLAVHYDLILVDLRYYQPGAGEYTPSLSALAEAEHADAILFLYNMDTFSSDTNLMKILSR